MPKAVDKEYLISSLKGFNEQILSKTYEKTLNNRTILNKLSESNDGSLTYNGEKIGKGISAWSDISDKPFNSIDPTTLSVEDDVLKVIGGQGIEGKSAYQIWLDEGNVGTENDFIMSLKGDKGEDGKSISAISKDENNNIIVTFSDGTKQNIGKLNIDVSADFLTSDGFGNLRYYNGHFQYYNTTISSWVDIETTVSNKVITFLTPNSMKKFEAKYNMILDRNFLLIEEPDDTIIDEQVLCFVEKIIIRRKKDSAPIDDTDGDLVVIIPRREFGSYSYNGYVDNDVDPSEGEKWYYRAFPVSTLGIVNSLEENNITYTPMPIKLDSCTNLNFDAQDGKVLVIWNDPESTKTVDGQTVTWKSTILVYKEGITAPTSLTDGIIAIEEKTLNQYSESGFELPVENGKDYSFSLFAITTDGAISEKTSGTVSMYVTLSLTTDEESLYGKSIVISYNNKNITGTFNSSGFASFKISWIGEINISCSDGSDTANSTLQITEFNVNINKFLSFLLIVTFADGTDEQIAAMVQAHYDGKINISDYWAIGDTRSIDLEAMEATGVSESHRAQTVQFVIGDFDHDDLTTTINGHTKAAITLLQKDCLMDESNASSHTNGRYNAENGYMNSTETNSGGWKSCARRTWCNDVYFNALPSVLQSMVKIVDKKASAGNKSTTIETVQDKIFLAAEIEIFGTAPNSCLDEGTQYQYYKNVTANRYKMPKWNSSTSSHVYWGRSPYTGGNVFCRVGSKGESMGYGNNSDNLFGIAPCLCV